MTKPLLSSPVSWILASLSGLLCALSFPLYDLEFLAWFGLVPLFLALEKQTVKSAFRLGGMAGLVFFLGTVNWVTVTMVQYGKIPYLVSLPIMWLLVGYLALYFAAFAAIYSAGRRLGAWIFLFAPALWVALEYLRNFAFTGFPWAALGYSQYRNLAAIQIADRTGVYGVSFLLILVNLGLTEAVRAVFNRSLTRTAAIGMTTACLAVALDLGYGAWKLSEDPSHKAPTFRVGVVQANIPQDVKWDPAFRQETIDRYDRLTRSLFSDSVQLIIWPEAATPFIFQEDAAFGTQVIRAVREGGTPLLFGSPAFTEQDGRLRLLNSALLLSPDGNSLGRYDKLHLVPFGEYVPLSGLLFFVDKMVEGIGNFVPGRKIVLFDLPEVRFGTVICYEVIFPDLVRRFVDEGARLMTTITNDAWFGRSAAAQQHFAMVVFRAVENRVPFARAANTGISGFIDRTGRILEAGDLFVEATMVQSLRLRTETSFYTRRGDLFAGACVIIALAATAAALFLITQRKESPHA